MGMKRRGSELDHEAKKFKSDDGIGNDEVSSSNSVQTTPVLSRQPITDLNDLSQIARRQIRYLLQALRDVSPQSLSEVDILGQINAINSDSRRPIFTYKPPDTVMIIGHSPREIDVGHNCEKIGGGRLVSTISAVPYANGGYFTVEIDHPQLYMGNLAIPCREDWESKFEETPWKDEYLLQVQSLAREAVIAHNREVLCWWLRKIAHAETPLRHFSGREMARGEFLTGDVVWTTASRDTWGFHG
ncbi:hypothetical protein FDENT_971 [Fusarium denticulatum]|uniref:Uncharacterized protein n=1 Tax=Fusarium denticulatum TaxID=48507 RepID=A0A8H6CWP1_9HYPO|nr:hypothetical protein FDENT_971 [Fusarium denticulatum]